MELEYYPWKLDVDVEGTKEFYNTHDFSIKKKENEKLRKKLTKKQLAFFDTFGVNFSHLKVERNDIKMGKIKYIYETSFLVKGKLKSITSFQAEVYADEEVFGKKILENLEVVDVELSDVLEEEGADNNIDGMVVSFKHPAVSFGEEEYPDWDCGYICVKALLKKEYDFTEPCSGPKIKREDFPVLPYSLHDSHIKKMKLHKVNKYCGNVTFLFKKGFFSYDKEDPYYCETKRRKAGRKIVFEQVELYFSNVYVMKVKGENYGRLKGEKYSLEKFIKKYPKADIEIVDETYGYYESTFRGYSYLDKKKIREIMIVIFHDGGMYYMI